MQRIFLFPLLLLLSAPLVGQTTWYVDQSGNGDFLTIQEGIDASANGDTVIVRDGTYPEAIQLNGRAITLKSENGPAVTEITGAAAGDITVKIQNGEGRDTVIEGFRIPQTVSDQGVFIQYSSPTLIDLEVSGFTSKRAVEILDSSPLMTGCLITGNTQGGVISTNSQLEISDSIFQYNSLPSGASGGGAGLLSSGGGLTLIDSLFDGNSNGAGGGGAVSASGIDLTVLRTEFSGNSASSKGGAVHWLSNGASQGFLVIHECIFRDNHSGSNLASCAGGALSVDAPHRTPVSISDSDFTGNWARDEGGAVFFDAPQAIVQGCTFSGNGKSPLNSPSTGGAVYGHEIVIRNSSFVGNGRGTSVDSTAGGALWLSGSSQVVGCSFIDNTGRDGGALYASVYSSSYRLEINDCAFTSNSAQRYGSTITTSGSGTVTLDNCLVSGSQNLSVSTGAIARYPTQNTRVEIMNTTIADNHAFGDIGYLTMTNSVAWGNNGFVPYGKSVTFCCIEGGYPGIGNIPYDPLFVTGPQGDYYLSQIASGQATDSSCLDAGDPASSLVLGTTRTDEIADQGRPDIGYHYPVPAPPPPVDTDGDGISDQDEINISMTDPFDDDTDDDGLSDGEEFVTNQPRTNPTNFDSDGDGLSDGLEMGMDQVNRLNGTDPGVFVPDADPATTTSPVKKDTDNGGTWDSVEDENRNGAYEYPETDPNSGGDDIRLGDLVLSDPQVSMAAGGIVELRIDFPPKYKEERFLVLGSVSGSGNGFRIGRVRVPLKFDFLTAELLTGQYYPQMVNFDSQLDASGDALALVVMAPNSPASLAGLTLSWSAIVVPAYGYPLSVTNAASVQFVQ